MDKSETIYTEEGTDRKYKLAGCPTNGVCFCTGSCRRKIYLDGKNTSEGQDLGIQNIKKNCL